MAIPILTARVEEADHVRAFRLDADPYVTKPFRLLERLERINMMLRRGRTRSAPSDAERRRIARAYARR